MKYRTIVADPPWEHPDSGARTQSTAGNWRGKWLGYESKVPYERMTLADICALPVPDLAEDDAHLYLWTTNGFLRDAYGVVEAWGFKPSTLLTWCKAPMGIGLGGATALRRIARSPRDSSTWSSRCLPARTSSCSPGAPASAGTTGATKASAPPTCRPPNPASSHPAVHYLRATR